MSEPDPNATEYIVLRPEPGLPVDDMPGIYADKLLARAEFVAEGQRFLRFHEGDIVWAYPSDRVETVEGGLAQVWTVSRTVPHEHDPALPRDEP